MVKEIVCAELGCCNEMRAQLITRARTGCMYNMQSEKSAFQPLFYHSAIECRDEIEEVSPLTT